MRTLAPAKSQGTALLLVVWVLALLSLLAAMLLQIATVAARTSHNTLQRVRAEAAADGAVALALLEFVDPDPQDPWRADGSMHTLQVGADRVAVSVRDVAGMLDVNEADDRALHALFVAAGATMPDAEAAVAAIDRYRGSERPGQMDVSTPVSNPAPPVTNPARRFWSIEEFWQVSGLSQHVFACLRSSITVYAKSPGVDLRYASALLRGALEVPAAPTPPDATMENRGIGGGNSGHFGHLLSVRARVLAGSDRAAFVRDVTVRLTGQRLQPLLVMRWRVDEYSKSTADCRR